MSSRIFGLIVVAQRDGASGSLDIIQSRLSAGDFRDRIAQDKRCKSC